MKRILTSITLVILYASLSLLASPAVMAQSGQASRASSIDESNRPQIDDCSFYPDRAFIFSSGAHLFKFCLTDRANIVNLISPAGFTHIDGEEGYVVCGTGVAPAWSNTNIEANNWGAPSINQPGGPGTLPVTFTRLTPGGKIELKQTFEWNTAEKEILITKTLKNITATSISNVRLSRYFVGKISNDYPDDIFDRDSDSVWGIDDVPGAVHHGVMLTALNLSQAHSTFVELHSDWNPNGNTDSTATKCTAIARAVPTAAGHYVGRITYVIGTLAAGASKTVQVVYRRF